MSQTRVRVKGRVTQVSRWENHPTKELKSKRDIAMPTDARSPAVSVPPVKPINYAVKTRKQPLEQALTEAEYLMLAKYVYRVLRLIGQPKTSSDEIGGGGYTSKSPVRDENLDIRDWVNFISDRLAFEHKEKLNELLQACASDCNFDPAGIGKDITGSKDLRQQIGGFKGYYKAVAQAILENDKKHQFLLKYSRSGKSQALMG